jgi:hypothetical protein
MVLIKTTVMKILKTIGIVLVTLIALFLIIPLFVKNTYRVEKSVDIQAEKEIVFDYMRHFENFDKWSPWAELDPNMEVEITGTDGEEGATYYWKGNDDVGEGTMLISSINTDEIKIEISFIAPFKAQSPSAYKFKDNEGSTTVSWSMEGNMNYPWNIFMLFMDMEEAIGSDFEKGLSKLRHKLEM